ncbi:MAG TPA: GNAT family N-acetyltransferase [Actinomycetota bacterium]|nr:GNAT family N-acetyltransferase [Actinomycetota bacterium]
MTELSRQDPALPARYPAHRIADMVLRDGSTVRIRPVLPSDADQVLALFGRLSTESLARRFHGVHRLRPSEARYFCTVDYVASFGLVAEHGGGPSLRVVALANYFATRPGVAECAFCVDENLQGRGLGSILVEHLAEAAAEAGITTFEADVVGSNTAMLGVFGATGLPLEREVSAGEVHLEFPTSLTPAALEAFDRREATAAAAGVAALLRPRTVAVVGASRRQGSVGAAIFRNLVSSGFQGTVFPVNPKEESVLGVACFPSARTLPTAVDLAVIVVPAPAVLEVARDCGEGGVRALLVISAGFAEVGAEGRARQAALVELARAYGMRIMGPNCLGVINLDPDVRLNASFAPELPAAGTVAFTSQSGALGIALLDEMNSLGLGVSSFASLGNKADLTGSDLLEYWEQDPRTGVVLMYLESLANPRRFARVARRVGRAKPVVAIKSGRSKAGARAAASHTGSLAQGEAAVGALFRQAGIIRTETLEELFEVAGVLARQPLPPGNRVGILTNGGGLGVLCADACETAGLAVPAMGEAAAAALREFLPPQAAVGNPVDMLASATGDHYRRSLEILLADDGLDAVVVAFIPPVVTEAAEAAAGLLAAAGGATKTVVACFAGVEGAQRALDGAEVRIPAYRFPESAARSLARAADYAAWRRAPAGTAWHFGDIDHLRAAALAAQLLADPGPGWLSPLVTAELLGCYGIDVARGVAAATPQEVATAAEAIGGPVAVKITSRSLLHKSDVGGVALGLATPGEAVAAAERMQEALASSGLGAGIDGFLVQEMVAGPGMELFVGVVTDPLFGPLLACGAGGTLVELLRDVSVRITPVTREETREMVRALKTFPVLEGYRGSPALDSGALEQLVGRVGLLVEDLPVAEVDLNPAFVRPAGQGCLVLDARIRLAPPPPRRPMGSRLNPAAPARPQAG